MRKTHYLLGLAALAGLCLGALLAAPPSRLWAGDEYAGVTNNVLAPGRRAAAVTPDNSNDLATFARALYVGSGGDVKVDTVGADTVTFVAVPTGAILPVRARRVYATGTTASSIVAIW